MLPAVAECAPGRPTKSGQAADHDSLDCNGEKEVVIAREKGSVGFCSQSTTMIVFFAFQPFPVFFFSVFVHSFIFGFCFVSFRFYIVLFCFVALRRSYSQSVDLQISETNLA